MPVCDTCGAQVASDEYCWVGITPNPLQQQEWFLLVKDKSGISERVTSSNPSSADVIGRLGRAFQEQPSAREHEVSESGPVNMPSLFVATTGKLFFCTDCVKINGGAMTKAGIAFVKGEAKQRPDRSKRKGPPRGLFRRKHEPEKTATDWFDEGATLESQKLYTAALLRFKRAVALDPYHTRALESMAHTLVRLERFEEALPGYNRALALDPQCADALYGKATTLANLGRSSEAEPLFERARKQGHPEAEQALAKLRSVEKLRELTGCSASDCTRVLEASDGDVDKALDLLNKEGLVALKSDVLSSGFLSIAAQEAGGAVVDPDISKYPDILLARRDPDSISPTLLDNLESLMPVLVREGNQARVALFIRAATYDLQQPIGDSMRLSLHIEAHNVSGIDVYGIYALIWDNPDDPYFAEYFLLPYDLEHAPDSDFANPIYSWYSWRKLYHLLTADSVEFIVVDGDSKVQLVKTVPYTTRQMSLYRQMAKGLGDYHDTRISAKSHSPRVIIPRYREAAAIEEINRRFHSSEGGYSSIYQVSQVQDEVRDDPVTTEQSTHTFTQIKEEGEDKMSHEATITQYLRQLGAPAAPFGDVPGVVGVRGTIATYMGLQVDLQVVNDQFLLSQFVIGYAPPANAEPLLRQLMIYNSVMIGVYFCMFAANGAIVLRFSRPLEGLDFAEFKQSLDTLCSAWMQNGVQAAQMFQLSGQPLQ